MRMAWLLGHHNKRAPWMIALLVLVGSLVLRGFDPGELVRLRDFAFDGYQRLKPRTYNPEAPVRIVDIDEAALAEFGQWPWPRTVLARLVDKLAEKGAAVIAFDVVFAEPDRASMSRLVHDLVTRADPATLDKLVESIEDNDNVLAKAIAGAPVVLGFGFEPKATPRSPRVMHGLATTGDDPAQFLPVQNGTVATIPILEAAAKGNGSVNTDIDSVVIRRVPLLFRLAGLDGLLPALSIEALRVAQGAKSYLVKSSGASSEMAFGEHTGIVAIKTGDLQVRTDPAGRLLLYDSGHREERFISARDVMLDKTPADRLEANVVFVGTSALGLKDIRNTPVGGAVPGVEVHAQLAEQMLEGKYLERPDYATGAEFLYLAAIGILLVLLLPRLKAGPMALIAALFIAIGVVVPWLAYSQYDLLFDPIYPPATLAAIYVAGSATAFMRTERERAAIRGAFGMYLSPEVVEQLARNPDLLQLGGEMRDLTIMFTDVRGFTRISEQFDPLGLTRFMNRFLTPMTDLILGHRGTIDKYMGDAIMAFWNAPLPVENHAALACDTALAMHAELRRLNLEWMEEAKTENRPYIPVNIGVGLNTGLASVGNFGSTQRFTYTCLSDDVNLASRLEGQCKTYGVSTIVGEKTRDLVPNHAVIELDLIMVKGKTEPERIFALLGGPELVQKPEFAELVRRQEELLGHYRSGGFAEALELIDGCRAAAEAAGWQQGYYDMMKVRIDGLIDESPPDWTGVYVAKEK